MDKEKTMTDKTKTITLDKVEVPFNNTLYVLIENSEKKAQSTKEHIEKKLKRKVSFNNQ